MPKDTALIEVHRALGANLVDFAGWTMPIRYGSETAEHQTVRTTAGLFDLSHMGEIEVRGPEAARTLDRALVGRPSAIKNRRARYSMICAEDGGIIDDLVIYRLADDDYLVVANAANVANVANVAKELAQRGSGHNSVVRNASEEWALIAVQGPRSAEIMSEVTDADVPALRYYAIDPATLGGQPVLLARTGYTGEDGFEIYCRPDAAVTVWQTVAKVGADYGLRPAGLAARDTLRLEAGMPLYGHELSRDITPFEAGLGRVVVFDKSEGFVGDQALALRRDAGPETCLVGLRTFGRRSPRSGHQILAPSHDADPATPGPTDPRGAVGSVTSGSPSPTLGHPIAMAYLPVKLAELGTRLAIDVRGQPEEAEVVQLPFYNRPRSEQGSS